MDLVALVHQCTPAHVSVQTMTKIMTVESAHRENAIGYKIIGANGKTFMLTSQPKNKEEAITWAKWFSDNGYEYDAGPLQIHSTNFGRYGLTPATAFDTCSNIKAGAGILSECYDRAYKKYGQEQLALRVALSCYQSGNFSGGFRTGYVGKVVNANFANSSNEIRRR